MQRCHLLCFVIDRFARVAGAESMESDPINFDPINFALILYRVLE